MKLKRNFHLLLSPLPESALPLEGSGVNGRASLNGECFQAHSGLSSAQMTDTPPAEQIRLLEQVFSQARSAAQGPLGRAGCRAWAPKALGLLA